MERIHVTVRSRPLSAEEAKNSPWKVSGNSIFTSNNSCKFEFDQIFGEKCKTREVYEARTREIVAAAVRGFNGTVFAYGQTNSGKTHTMRGSDSEPGVIPLAVADLFDTIQQEVDREFLLRMSYMEIYNEDINDLLAPEHRKLQIHESVERGIFVAGLREEIVASPQQVLDLMAFGESHRHTGETNMNLHSSRSHTIFRMIIESREMAEDEVGNSCDAVRVSVLNLVDLAGSERAAKTGAEGVRLKEGSHINKSLMTLGTVIKKLSEGVESQGGHVPYRDSKLTRILQPALGGNANTAIICNITLAQIHADETRSSLQFASRALRVTNCARVNEILTDAALLKRQKKEIEELRAKLLGSHSEHLEEEILNLRNTLLQSELERERIALELEEEKKAQAERERMLQQQAKKIENLSSIVLLSNRDESRDYHRKKKRRDTWCFGNIPRVSPMESKSPERKAARPERDTGVLVPFEELVNGTEDSNDCHTQQEIHRTTVMEDCFLPDPCTLLHVTNRRKLPPKPPKKKISTMEGCEQAELLSEYENLLLEFETERTINDIHIDYLTTKLAEAAASPDGFKCNVHSIYDCEKFNDFEDRMVDLRELEAIQIIKQLQEKINILEMEKFSSQQNLDSLVEVMTTTEQNMCGREKFEEGDSDSSMVLIKEVNDLVSEADNCSDTVQSVSSLFDEVIQIFTSSISDFHNFKILMNQNCAQQKSVVTKYDKLHHSLSRKISEVEDEKHLWHSKVTELQQQVHELGENAQNYKASLDTLSQQNHLEISEYISYIQALEKELSCSSSASLLKEKESLMKDLEKTKKKLKDTEAKLKNVIQEKTKLEGEKVCAEREVKRLLGQQTLLERDINKRDSLAATRRESIIDRSKVFDARKAKVLDQIMKEDYQKLEVLGFEMETTIASLEIKLAAVEREKETVISVNENLSSELEALTKKFDASSSELNMLEEEISDLKLKLEQSSSNQVEAERTINRLVEEKEELAMQLCNSLLEMEEERAIWCSKEKAYIEAIGEKEKLYRAEIKSLSQGMLEAREELDFCKEECRMLRKRLASYENDAKQDEKYSIDKSLVLDQMKDKETAAAGSNKTQDVNFDSGMLPLEPVQAQEKMGSLQLELGITKREREDLIFKIRELEERPNLSAEVQNLRVELPQLSKEKQALLTQIEELEHREAETGVRENNNALLGAKSQIDELQGRLNSTEVKMHQVEVNNGKQKAKLRMRLRGTQAQLDAFKYRHKQMVAELEMMNAKFEEASANLKEMLASKAIEVVNLKRELAVFQGR